MKTAMKKLYLAILLITISGVLYAQDDLLNMMEKEAPSKASPVYATFKSTRVINLQSNETMKAKHLDFRIQHRFDAADFSKDNVYGLYNFFGLDAAKMRFSLDYGITDRIMVGVGRSPLNKAYDGSVKVQLMRQKSKGSGSFPLSIVYFGNTAVNTEKFADETRQNFFTSRLTFVNQIIFTRKFNEYLSVAVTPTMVHHNLVPNASTPNDIYAVGVGASVKLTRSTRFNIEYIPRINGRDQPKADDGSATYYDAVAIGFDVETGGHVFQLHFTNAVGLIEQQFITENQNKVAFNQLRFGFNLSRTFSFDKNVVEKKKW